MSTHKEDNNRSFKPQIHQKKRRGQNRQNFGNRDRNRSYSRNKDKTVDPSIEHNHKTDNVDVTVGEDVMDIKIMIIEMTVETEGDKILKETLAMTNMTIAEQEIEV